MGKVADRIEDIKRIKELRDKGEVLCIPFHQQFPILAKFVPGIVKGILYKVTAGSGVGKTQATKQLFCITPLEYIRNNPDTKVKVKIFYFALEESEEEFIDSLIVNRLAMKFNIRIDVLMLKGLRENYVDEELLSKIEQCTEDVQYYMDHIEVIDSVYNPTGLYKYCRTYSEKVGKHIWNDIEFVKNGEVTKDKIYSHYEPDDPNLHVIVITDHFSLIQGEYDKKSEKFLTQHQAMAKWSTDYGKKQITKHWNWTMVNVQQQEQGSEKQQFTTSGESIIKKTEPTLDGLANNKEIQRDDYVVIGVYSPDRFGFDEYHGYDISRFRDTFRVFKILKNRIGIPNKYIHFMFDGATNRFVELPIPGEDNGRLNKAYESADKLLGRT